MKRGSKPWTGAKHREEVHVVMTLSMSHKLGELQKERDAFRNAKTGVTEVMLDYQKKSNASLPDPALQKLIDFADRRINHCEVMIRFIELSENGNGP